MAWSKAPTESFWQLKVCSFFSAHSLYVWVYLVFYFLMRPISLFCYILYKNLLLSIQRINTKNLSSFTLLTTFLCGPKVNSCKHVLRLERHCICKMYRCMRVSYSDDFLQCIVWRESSTELSVARWLMEPSQLPSWL